MNKDSAHVLIDALNMLRREMSRGYTPWNDYDGQADDPKTDRASYRALLNRAQTQLTEMIEFDTYAVMLTAEQIRRMGPLLATYIHRMESNAEEVTGTKYAATARDFREQGEFGSKMHDIFTRAEEALPGL